ncbi:MAG: response regulator transcription factor [Clostridia bacterium]|nr:response regulator transcription factor [Clostridia bacterium]
MKTIAIVDDDPTIGNLLEELLTGAGHRVLRAWSGTEALLLLSQTRPDLVLLDLMLPGLSGEEVLPRLRGVPVIVVSARAGIDDKVNLLLGGAADYITKPFDVRELLARVEVQLRMSVAQEGAPLVWNDLRLDPDTREVFASDAPVHLTRTEFAILKLLVQNPRQVIPKSRMLERISEDTPDCVESSLKVHVSNLRGKLRAATGRDCIEAVWGIGFRLRDPE